VRTFAPRSESPQKNRKAITSLEAKKRQKAEEDFSEARAMMQEAQRIIQREFIGRLPPDQGTVMWGVFSLKPEEQIAEELGLSVIEIRRLRGKAERALGGRLNF
jgi:DNA-directed RNA polymerase specialized sigma24 family protein